MCKYIVSFRLLYNVYLNIWNVEPIGYKAPSLANKAESITFKHAVNTTFVLLCECQAFPVAIFRYLLTKFPFC